eukprot:RCo035127
MKWAVLRGPSGSPSPRYGHVMMASEGFGPLAFGGLDTCVRFDELWRLDLRALQWVPEEPASPVRPALRAHHCGVAYAPGHYLVFGGEVQVSPSDTAVAEDLWEYSSETKEWTEVYVKPDVYGNPPGRMRAAMVHIPSYGVLLFGGMRQDEIFLNDMWLLNTTAWTWRRVHCDSAPPPRSGHAL